MKLALERAFYFPSCEVYGDAQAGFWEYGPTGVSIKNKFLELWRRELVRRDRMLEIDGSQIMSKSVFEASGHLGNFADPIIKWKKCGLTSRADKLIAEITNVEIPESADLEDFDKMIQEKNIVCTKCKGEFDASKTDFDIICEPSISSILSLLTNSLLHNSRNLFFILTPVGPYSQKPAWASP